MAFITGAGIGYSIVCSIDNLAHVEVIGTENGVDGYPYVVYSDGRKGVILNSTFLYEGPYLSAESLQILHRGQYVSVLKGLYGSGQLLGRTPPTLKTIDSVCVAFAKYIVTETDDMLMN